MTIFCSAVQGGSVTGESFELTVSAFCSALYEGLFMAVHSHVLCPSVAQFVGETSLGYGWS